MPLNFPLKPQHEAGGGGSLLPQSDLPVLGAHRPPRVGSPYARPPAPRRGPQRAPPPGRACPRRSRIAVEFDPRRADGGGADFGASEGEGGGPGGQQENDDDGMDMGGRSTSTPAAEIEEQDVDPRRSDGGGVAEEMDRDGADYGGGDRPPSMTLKHRRHW